MSTRKVSNYIAHVNPGNYQRVVKSTRLARVSYKFTPVPETIEDDLANPALERLYRILLRLIRRGVADPSIRQLAAAMRRGIRQVQRYISKMVELGRLAVIRRRVGRNRNLTNVYVLTDLQRGVGDIPDTEKKGEKDLTTTTPAPLPRGVEGKPVRSRFALQWDLRRLQDKLDSMRVRARWNWGLHKAQERTKAALQAAVGTPEWCNRANGGLSWEERNPEMAAWYERELAKQHDGMMEA